MADDLLSIGEFAKRIKEKYPQYGSVPDQKLVFSILETYPQYRSQVNLAATGPSAPSVNVPTIPGQPAGTMGPVGKMGLKLAQDTAGLPRVVWESFPPVQAVRDEQRAFAGREGAPKSLGEVGQQAAGALNYDAKAISEAVSNRDWEQLAAEIVVPTAENIATARLLGPKPRSLAERSSLAASRRIAHATGGEVEAGARATRSIPEIVAAGGRSRSLLANVQAALTNTESRFKGYIQSLGGTPISGEPIARAIEAKISPDMRKVVGGALADALQAEADAFRGKITVSNPNQPGAVKTVTVPQSFSADELNNIRMRLNSDLDTYFGKGAEAQAVDKHKTNAARIATITADDAVRDLLYDKLSRGTGIPRPAIDELKRTQGDLINLKQSTMDNLKKLQAESDYSYGSGAWQRFRGAAPKIHASPGGLGSYINVGTLFDAVRPRVAGELKRASTAGDVFRPRRTPFDATNSAVLAAILAGRNQQQ